MSKGKFELAFWGGTKFRYRRLHTTYESAEDAAYRVLEAMGASGDPSEQRAAHPAIIYGPDCGPHGVTIV